MSFLLQCDDVRCNFPDMSMHKDQMDKLKPEAMAKILHWQTAMTESQEKNPSKEQMAKVTSGLWRFFWSGKQQRQITKISHHLNNK
jgi:hypothetical protein